MPAATKNARRVAKRKVVPQTGGLFGFFESKPAAPGVVADANAPIAAAAAPAVAPAAAEGEKKGWFSGLFGSKTEPEVKKPVAPEGEKKGWFSGLFGSKTEPAAPAAPAQAQSGGKKRTTKKAAKATKSKK